MLGDEIVKRARGHFGENTALTLQDVTIQEWVNDAAKELYDMLYAMHPSEEMRTWIKEDSLALSGGEAAVPTAWDRIVNVKEGGVTLLRVPPETIGLIDRNQMFAPLQSLWSEREATLWVRPDTVTSVDVARLEPPDEISDFSVEVTEVHPKWHQALVWLVTSYAYAQEEDLASADHYRGRYLRLIGTPERTPEGGQNS